VAVLEKDVMLSLAENAVKAALKKGAAEAEAFVYEGKAKSVGIELGQITKSDPIIDRGLGVRVQLKKAIGFAYTNIMESQNAVEDVILKALGAARASKPDENWKGLPEKKPYAAVEKTFDSKVADLCSEDLVNVASTMLDSAVQEIGRASCRERV
jgi:PmbA protein